MKVVFLTQNNSLCNLWKSYKFAKDALFVRSIDDLLRALQKNKGAIACIDVAVFRGGVNAFISDLLAQNGELKILMVDNEPKFNDGKILLGFGVKGYANAHMQEVHFSDAFKAINDGNVWLYPEFIQQMIAEVTSSTKIEVKSNSQTFDALSSREKEIAQMIYNGLTNKDISDKTGITLRTVKAHTTSIYNKVGAKDRIGLVLFMKNQNV